MGGFFVRILLTIKAKIMPFGLATKQKGERNSRLFVYEILLINC